MGDEAKHAREQGADLARKVRDRQLEDTDAMLTPKEIASLEIQWSQRAEEPARTIKAKRLRGGTE